MSPISKNSNKVKQIKIMNKIKRHMDANKLHIPVVCKALNVNIKSFYNWLQGDVTGNMVFIENLYFKYLNYYNSGKEL